MSPEGVSLSQTLRKTKHLQTIWRVFQPVTDRSVRAVTEMVDVALKYFLSPASEPHLTIPDEVHEAIRGSRSARLRARTVYRTGH